MIEISNLFYPMILTVFGLGYLAIIFEYNIKINKTAVALLIAVLCWTIYFGFSPHSHEKDMSELMRHLSDVSQIIFFLMGAMTLVELIDSHKGFKIVTDAIQTTSKRKMLWIVAIVAFILSAILDNLTTTILMISVLRKMIPTRQERFLLSCIVVVAANAGGAWTPIGDVTTTMLWINGQLTTLKVIRALFLPSIISLLIPMLYFSWKQKGSYSEPIEQRFDVLPEPGAKVVFYLGVGALLFVPIFKVLTGLPPFMGMLIGVAVLWLVTDILHHKYEHRQHLRVPTILTKIDTSGILFFLGILLCINALEAAGILGHVAQWLEDHVRNQAMIATLIGAFSAIIDNVPLVAGTMGMYPLSEFPVDSSLWHMIAYAAGTGGSMLLIGSSAGVALMGFAMMKTISSGFDRGIFATDAGTGIAPILQSSTDSNDPISNGIATLIAPVLVMIVCTATGLVIMVTGMWESSFQSTNMVTQAFSTGLKNPIGGYIVTFALFLFSYTTILAWANCGERAVGYLLGDSWIKKFRWFFILMVPFGALFSVSHVWILADLSISLMLATNMVGIFGLMREVVSDTRAYYKA